MLQTRPCAEIDQTAREYAREQRQAQLDAQLAKWGGKGRTVTESELTAMLNHIAHNMRWRTYSATAEFRTACDWYLDN